VRPGPRWLVAAALAVAGAAATGDEPPRRADAARLMNELMSGRSPIGTSFSLPDQRGRRVGPTQWRGRVVLLYFGYLFCPDVCPTDLRAIADAIAALGAEGAMVQPVFMTLDPERDTADLAGRYAEAFHPRFAALRGSDAETRRVAEAYKVFYEKVPQRNGGYVIDHTSFTYVLDVEGRYVGYFPPGTSGKRMADFVRSLVPHAPAAAAR
jgi:cytochrome oxidase Cu insertion factor (SCO1/SenC/PrrC family)